MRRVVLDANVLISAVLFPGVCRTIMELLGEDKVTLVLSPALLEDFLRAIEKPRLKKLLPPDLLEEMISLIHRKAFIVEPKIKIKACRDPSDDAVLEAAIAGKAGMVVSGDKDLLTMNPFRNLAIVSPRTFLNKFRAK